MEHEPIQQVIAMSKQRHFSSYLDSLPDETRREIAAYVALGHEAREHILSKDRLPYDEDGYGLWKPAKFEEYLARSKRFSNAYIASKDLGFVLPLGRHTAKIFNLVTDVWPIDRVQSRSKPRRKFLNP